MSTIYRSIMAEASVFITRRRHHHQMKWEFAIAASAKAVRRSCSRWGEKNDIAILLSSAYRRLLLLGLFAHRFGKSPKEAPLWCSQARCWRKSFMRVTYLSISRMPNHYYLFVERWNAHFLTSIMHRLLAFPETCLLLYSLICFGGENILPQK